MLDIMEATINSVIKNNVIVDIIAHPNSFNLKIPLSKL